MKVIVVATRSDKHTAEQFAPILPAEAKAALQLVASDFVREIYSRADGRGAILVCEAESGEAVRQRLSQLPLVQAGMLSLEIYPVGPYRGIVAAANA